MMLVCRLCYPTNLLLLALFLTATLDNTFLSISFGSRVFVLRFLQSPESWNSSREAFLCVVSRGEDGKFHEIESENDFFKVVKFIK